MADTDRAKREEAIARIEAELERIAAQRTRDKARRKNGQVTERLPPGPRTPTSGPSAPCATIRR